MQLGRRQYNRCLYNAARYYELRDELPLALRLYEQCDEQNSIRSLLIRNARRSPGSGHYYELRHYYFALPRELVASSPILMSAMSMLYSILMDDENSEYWYDQLQAYVMNAQGGERKEAMSLLLALQIGLPHRGSVDVLQLMKDMPAILGAIGGSLPMLSLTGNQPSVMNGGKDFCEWTRKDRMIADTFGKAFERLLGQTGVGLRNLALGESWFEKGKDLYTVISHLTKAQSEIESNGRIEMLYVSIALQARVAVSTGDIEQARKLLAGIEQRIRNEKALWLLTTLKAQQCRLSLTQNELQSVRKWLKDAPDETVEFCITYRYAYTTKILSHLANGDLIPAILLIERMNAFAEHNHRTYIQMECGLLLAIALRRNGQPWEQGFAETLTRIADYGFIRIISEHGAAVLPLIQDIRTQWLNDNPQYAEWFERVSDETSAMARRYPNYLKGMGIDLSDFSETAITILRMQASGYSTKEIAEKLHIAQSTVKYHSKENYRKLDARDLVDAVQIAQSMHIL